MKTFKDLEFKTLSDPYKQGKVSRVMFDNGWGASVVSHTFSYGGKSGLYELAVLDSDGELHYDNSVAQGDVRGYLSEDVVTDLLIQIQKL